MITVKFGPKMGNREKQYEATTIRLLVEYTVLGNQYEDIYFLKTASIDWLRVDKKKDEK